jgi:hypothetical protein
MVFGIVRTMGKSRVSGLEAVCFWLMLRFGIVPVIVRDCASLCSIVQICVETRLQGTGAERVGRYERLSDRE